MCAQDFFRSGSTGILERSGPYSALKRVLSDWTAADAKPRVLFVDEIDSLVGDTLISVLRQLRCGYRDRLRRFPQGVVLCGVRDVRDYRIRSASGEVVLGGSAFNIKAKSLRQGDFTEGEVRDLLGQHIGETGQAITEEVLDGLWEQTRGQPWLVNAVAYEACFEDKAARDRSRPITLDAVKDARERLIVRRDTHRDQLVDKLREPRVRRVIEPLLSGGLPRLRDDDIAYVRDLGLVAPSPPLAKANPIYREVIPRELTSDVQETHTHKASWYVDTRRIPKSELIVKVRDWAENSVPEPAQVRWPWSRNRVAGMLSGCWPAPEATPHGARAQRSRPRSPRGCWVPHPARDVPPALVRIRAGCCG